MNQTRLLIGILLLLGAVFGYTQWSHKQDLRMQREETAKLIETLGGKAAATAEATAPKTTVAAGEKPAAEDVAAESPEEQRLRILERELDKLRAEKENYRAQSEAASEERDQMASENEALKYQIDQRIAQIRAAPMLAKITYVNLDHGIAVMSAGRAAGVEPKDEFRIRRGDKIICRVLVGDSIEDSEAVLAPVPGTMAPKETILEGDEVVSLE